jgi:hypothetical protein
MVLQGTSSTAFLRRKPASISSSTLSGNGAVAEYARTGSPPMQTATGILCFNSFARWKCFDPPLWICQCMPVDFLSKTCRR